MIVLGFDYKQVQDEMSYEEYKDYEALISNMYEEAEAERKRKWSNFVSNGGLKTKIKRCYINGNVKEKEYDYDNPTIGTIKEYINVSSTVSYDRKKKTDEELAEEGLTEEEINFIHEERIRKSISAVRNNIYRRMNEREFYYFVTFTSNKKYIYNNPKLLLKLAKSYLKMQGIEGVLALEPFYNITKGWHIHGVTNKAVNFDEWHNNYGANEDDFENKEEEFNKDFCYYEGKNLYCNAIYTDIERCYNYMIKKLDYSYRLMKTLYPNDAKVKIFDAVGTSTPNGSHIGNYLGFFEYINIFNSSIHNYNNVKTQCVYRFNKAIEEENLRFANNAIDSWLYENLNRFLPLFNKFSCGLKKKDRWRYLDNDKKNMFNFLKNDLINIAEEYKKLQKLNNDSYGFKNESYNIFCYITEKLAYENREKFIRYKFNNIFEDKEEIKICHIKEKPICKHFIYEEFKEIITWAYEEAEKRIEDREKFETFLFVQKKLEEEKQYKKELQIKEILDKLQGIINYINILHFVAIRKENKKENRNRVYIINNNYKAVFEDFMLNYIGLLHIN